MKICALTMVHRDYWALSQWYAHHQHLLGAENLYVVAHGADPKVQDLCPGASVISIPRDQMDGFDGWRGKMLNGFQAGLAQIYDWVIRTDADELICLDPNYWSCLSDMLEQQQSPALFALGFDVFDLAGTPKEDADRPVLAQQPQIVFSGHYSKACLASGTVALKRHGVALRPRKLAQFPFVMPRGLYLAHLKYANLSAVQSANRIRIEVAESDGTRLPGSAWRNARQETRKRYSQTEALPVADWDSAEAEAWQSLQTPVRDQKASVLRCKSIRSNVRTTLPNWFQQS